MGFCCGLLVLGDWSVVSGEIVVVVMNQCSDAVVVLIFL